MIKRLLSNVWTALQPETYEKPVTEPVAPIEHLYQDLSASRLKDLAADAQIELSEISEGVFQTVYEDVVLRLSTDPERVWLLVKAEFPVTQPGVNPEVPANALSDEENDKVLHLLIDATNEWNARWFLPTAYVDKVDAQWMIRLDCTFFVAEGATPSQFKTLLHNAAQGVRTAIRELPKLIPPGF
ncbi:hypothetical protein HMPREF0044_1025 [Gleimia coleocanis DSM 15436]|uniref:Bacterial sensory transduction regulator n=1 Tax=Gleimia coleocanis DSM 15436 TaxID=525245 RepID=C0W0E7_9ACTO|nr:YbjN domain-containing protein [Gleimia coleocanis]EEH64006.1 hypothetical protein HMPREF0044_1025 [Gleimia coleocanis DSM 15436]